ncbi:M56 family metallopeptidase [Nocardia mangyaensis]|uniref:M56 family metallopeptidase n=1 Tax=Nocardia mangyaensis TaxID=2213200 RepID=UPI002676E692|nr:M56 family metallopeptidase [Nocardia mangyaensis]MDO3648082.1 M56 family metallopeptidase [Nocardia mangyaensis]
MILLTALLAAGIALAVAAPAVLSRVDFTGAPIVGMMAWLGAVAATIGCGVLALIALAWPGDPPGNIAAGKLVESLAAVEPTVVTWTAGLIMPVAVIGAILPTGQLARIAIGHRGRGAALRRRHRALVEIVGRVDVAGAKLVRLEHPVPLAYSVAGRGGYVVVTDGLERCLDDAQWRAVLAHERAHLRGFHHHILGACQVLARAFSWIPLFAAAPAAVATLIEFAADRAAAAATDPRALSGALRTVASHGASRSAPLGLIDESLARRLECLSAAPDSRSSSRRTAGLMLVATMSLAPIASVIAVGLSAALVRWLVV